MWSHRQNVNLLVAGANLPSKGHTGSAIYAGQSGSLSYEFINTPKTRLLSANVLKTPRTYNVNIAAYQAQNVDTKPVPNLSNATVLPGLLLRKEPLESFKVEFLNFTQGAAKEELKGKICVNNINSVCCEYDVSVERVQAANASVSRIHLTLRRSRDICID